MVDVALAYRNFDISGARVVLQGYGAVGRHAAHFLVAQGAVVVGVADSRGTIHDPTGLDLDELDKLKAEGRSVIEYANGHKLKREEVVGISCDIWIPAARPDVVHKDNVHQLDTRLVVEGANIPVTPAAERFLFERGVLVVPDFIANAGGVICAAMEYRGMGQATAFQVIEEKLRSNTEAVLEASAAWGAPPRDAALAMATERVRRAMQTRRWSLF